MTSYSDVSAFDVDTIGNDGEEVDRLSDFYANEKDANRAIKELCQGWSY